MFSVDDTIVAISTPMGRGGLGVVRVSGPDAERIVRGLIGRAARLRPRHATLGTLTRPANSPQSHEASRSVRDQVVVTFFPAPQSATGNDVGEVSAHGSPVVLQDILRRALAAGARLASPGEFTLRAFLNGKLDLVQAEAVADLIDAVTPLQARAAFDQLEGTLTTAIHEIDRMLFDLIARLEASLDFPDEGYHFVERKTAVDEMAAVRARIGALLSGASRGRLIREGAQVAIVGRPNVGKSSLFNALLSADRAIVTPIAGTTRDLLTERAEIGGVSISLVDTAGVRETTDVVEVEGVSRARQALRVADLAVVMFDGSQPLGGDDRRLLATTASIERVLVINKADLPSVWPGTDLGAPTHQVSVLTGQGVDTLAHTIAMRLGAGGEHRDQPLVSNVRHIDLLERSNAALSRAEDALRRAGGGLSEEFVLADLQEASSALQEITGQRTTDDLLAHIFSRFCIGK